MRLVGIYSIGFEAYINIEALFESVALMSCREMEGRVFCYFILLNKT